MDMKIAKGRIIKNPTAEQLEELYQIGMMTIPEGHHWGGFRYLYDCINNNIYIGLSYKSE